MLDVFFWFNSELKSKVCCITEPISSTKLDGALQWQARKTQKLKKKI